METIRFTTNLNCRHCVAKIKPLLDADKGIIDYSVDLENPEKILTISSDGANISDLVSGFARAGYFARKL